MTEAEIREQFALHDSDNDGFITEVECETFLRQVIKNNQLYSNALGNEELDNLIKQSIDDTFKHADINGDKK